MIGTASISQSPGASLTFAGTLVALPATEPAPAGATNLNFTADTFEANGVTYDLTTVPTDPPHKLTILPEGTEIPANAILVPTF